MTSSHNFPIGISDFTKIIQKEYAFIDKTMFIKEIIDDAADVILITRPRRFGKTLAMSMLEAFFSTDGSDIFKKLNIAKETEFCSGHQNKYPVLFFSFKDCKYSDFDSLFIQIQRVFSNLYKKHNYLLEENSLDEDEKATFKDVLAQKISSPSQLASALADLISYVKKYTSIKPIVLIDEYDSPIYSSYTHGFYDKIIEFMRTMLGSALKDNPNLEKAIITGIAKVAQESMFSGLNNLQSYTILDDKYANYFGFTQGEVESLLPTPDLIEPIRSWYNGYTIGKYQIYNPWSIIECLSRDARLLAYWVNTSDNALVMELIDEAKPEFRKRIEAIMAGEIQDQIVQTNLSFKDIKTDENAVWTLLIHGGYLNVISSYIDESGYICAKVGVPNKEIMQVYQNILKKWFTPQTQSTNFYNTFLNSLMSGNAEEFARHIQIYIRESGSYFDFTKNIPERVFHMFILGILMGLRGKYNINSNRETGLGRADMILIPKDAKKQGVVLEFKVCSKPKLLQKTAQDALAQITDKHYTDAFSGSILALGMSFHGKEMRYAYKVIQSIE
jgi:hypothetical protein